MIKMRIIFCCLLVIGVGVSAEIREKRQATYTFPGPRSDAANRHAAAAVYQAQQQQQQQQQQQHQPQRRPRTYIQEEPDNTAQLYPVSRRQYPQEQSIQYVPAQQRAPQHHPAPQEAPQYDPPARAPAPAQRQSYAPQAQAPRRKATASRGNKYGSAPQQSLNGGSDDEEEEDAGPDPLTLLLEDSKFTCGGKTDGYYADDSVNCQVFHYCVSGARHSWMCPEGTVFHQVHLNCVPDSQDICAQSQKFHFVNDYLYKPVDYQGPNNTARYAQRYYPDGYVVGDPLVAPHENQAPRPQAAPPAYNRPQVQSYPAQAPASRPVHRQAAAAQPAAPPPQQSYQPRDRDRDYAHARALAASRGVRPSRPAYQAEVPPGYRPLPRHEPQPQAAPVPVDDDVYQPDTRRSAAPRGSAGYAPPRSPPPQHAAPPPQAPYRPSIARSSAARPVYPIYASNQAAGVQYDEDY